MTSKRRQTGEGTLVNHYPHTLTGMSMNCEIEHYSCAMNLYVNYAYVSNYYL